MSSSVLYRRYRPATFDDVVGQDHIVKTMRGAVENDTFAHAYLFAGSRGTGKTSVARIFATGIGVSPNDLYEIDAASNRGIDDVRELRDAVHAQPMESPYKLYLIDEVHMLTKEAFNALLKTLEEPPAHVVFILATTELEKLPETIVSRCQLLHFHRPTRATLKEMVINVASAEGYSIDAGAADLIALLGEGSFRDTLGMLQKVLTAAGDGAITEDVVAGITGAPQSETVNEIVKSIGYRQVDTALTSIHNAAAATTDMTVMTALVLQKLRSVLLMRFASDLEKEIQAEVGEDEFTFLTELKEDRSFVVTSDTISQLLDAYQRIGRTAVPELPLELAVVRLTETDGSVHEEKRV